MPAYALPQPNYGAATGYASGATADLSSLGNQAWNQYQGNNQFATQALTNAFDPQNTARNYYQQQMLGNVGAQEAVTGTAGTPYGAEVTGAANQAFLNNWQTAQVQRQNTGANTAVALQGMNLASEQLGGGLMQQSIQDMLQAYGLEGQNYAAAVSALAQILSAQQSAAPAGQNAFENTIYGHSFGPPSPYSAFMRYETGAGSQNG